jgi:hypothetical protein
MAYVSLKALREVFGGRVISRGLCLPRSPDLTPCDFYLFEGLKDEVYKTNPHTLEEVRNICGEISAISDNNSRELTATCSAVTLRAFGQEDNIFRHLL